MGGSIGEKEGEGEQTCVGDMRWEGMDLECGIGNCCVAAWPQLFHSDPPHLINNVELRMNLLMHI